MSGFTSWVENIASSKNAEEYRARVSDSESASMWQSLSYGANYNAAYCIAVCPAGDQVIQPFKENRSEFLKEVVKPLQEKIETVYVIGNSDSEVHVQKRFPNKKTKRVSNAYRPATINAFLHGLLLAFQPNQSKGIDATYHFTFSGNEEVNATVSIHDQKLQVSEGHQGKPQLHVTADSNTWLRFLRKEIGIVSALMRRKIKLKGSPRLLLQFSKCFPS